MPGLFITCEGCEGSGKSTFVQNFTKVLEKSGFSIRTTREPGGTLLGEKIRALLLHDIEVPHISPRSELLLFLASRAEHVDKVILPNIAEGRIVLCDRYIDSTIAYQAYGREQIPQEIIDLCQKAVPLMPKYTFYLDIDFETAQKRLTARQGSVLDKIEQCGKQFHDRVRYGFLELAKREPERIHILDARLSEDELSQKAYQFLLDKGIKVVDGQTQC